MRTNIRELREIRNISQKELGELVGVSRQTINYIELGKTSPKITVALKIAKIFNTTVEEIFELEEEWENTKYLQSHGPYGTHMKIWVPILDMMNMESL